jgi:SAM-dependent methyltransferase
VTAYETIGVGYASRRAPDPRIMAMVERALGDAASVVNVGAGTGSYEPKGPRVVAVEPARRMIAQRRPGAAPVLQGVAEHLPLADAAVDAALAVLTLHHWTDQPRACRELLRVARRRVVILTFDPEHAGFWLTQDYFPVFRADDRQRFPTLPRAAELLGGRVLVDPIPVPRDCVDGFLGCYWARPEAYLDPTVRRSISSFAVADPAAVDAGLKRLEADLTSGRWNEVHGPAVEGQDAYDMGYRLVVAEL